MIITYGHGNSVIGLRKLEKSSLIATHIDDYVEHAIKEGSNIISAISHRQDTTFDEINDDRRNFLEFQETIKPKKYDYDITCAKFIHGASLKNKLADDAAIKLATKHHAFHWELEFPEVFSRRKGFHLVIGNPPWEAIKPNDDEFFSRYYDGFRGLTNKADKKRIIEKLLENPDIKERFDDYVAHIRGQSRFSAGSLGSTVRGVAVTPTCGSFSWSACCQ